MGKLWGKLAMIGGSSNSWPAQAAASVALAVATAVAWWAIHYFISPLRRYPGPFLAGWTNWWRFSVVRSGRYPQQIKKLHEQYGPVVRIGPNTLDLDLPAYIKKIYTTDAKWLKSDFYKNNSTMINGQIIYNLFSESDPAAHAYMKRPVAKFYTPRAVLSIEPLIDSVMADLCDHLDSKFASTGRQCDIGSWIAYCTWDMVGASTFSENFGYMDKGSDHDGTIGVADKAIDYFSAVGQVPFLDTILDKNPIVRFGPPNLGNVTGIALSHIANRKQGTDKNLDPNVPDFLQSFLDAQEAQPDVVHDGMILNYVFINLIAGADTTAITLRAVLYFLMRRPETLKKLQAEISQANFDTKIAPYTKARALPYLEAVIRESMRLHPGVAMLLERYVPAEGLTLPDGTTVPGGTKVGINPYVVGRNKDVWGEDADEFRPERWLQKDSEGDGEYAERMRVFNASDLAFGAGSRICMGRHFSMIETYKLIATLVNRYDMELTDPNKEWQVAGVWFPRQKGIVCNLSRRS